MTPKPPPVLPAAPESGPADPLATELAMLACLLDVAAPAPSAGSAGDAAPPDPAVTDLPES